MSKAGDGPDHPLERVIFFSDAVFAIAITLLIIEIRPPHLHAGSAPSAYLRAVFELWPSFFGFFLSFFVIGAFWAGHHRAFALAGQYSERLLGPNIQMLCSIVFLPFSTAFMADNIGATVPMAFYNLSLIATGLLNIRLIRVATATPVVRGDGDVATIAYVRSRGWAVVLAALCALACSFIDARFSELALLTMPVWGRALRTRTARRLARLG